MKQSDLADIFRALSSEQRLTVFRMMIDRTSAPECCNGMLKTFTAACGVLRVSRSTVSHHIKELEQAGLISCERQGQAVCCTIDRAALQAGYEFFAEALRSLDEAPAS
jgi:ArsR family transcriptional regulator